MEEQEEEEQQKTPLNAYGTVLSAPLNTETLERLLVYYDHFYSREWSQSVLYNYEKNPTPMRKQILMFGTHQWYR